MLGVTKSKMVGRRNIKNLIAYSVRIYITDHLNLGQPLDIS